MQQAPGKLYNPEFLISFITIVALIFMTHGISGGHSLFPIPWYGAKFGMLGVTLILLGSGERAAFSLAQRRQLQVDNSSLIFLVWACRIAAVGALAFNLAFMAYDGEWGPGIVALVCGIITGLVQLYVWRLSKRRVSQQ